MCSGYTITKAEPFHHVPFLSIIPFPCCELHSCHAQYPQSRGCKPCAILLYYSQVYLEPTLKSGNNHVPQKDPQWHVILGKYHVTPYVTLHVTCHMIHQLVTCHVAEPMIVGILTQSPDLVTLPVRDMFVY